MISSLSCGVSHGGASRIATSTRCLVLVVFVEHVDVELHLHADLEIVRGDALCALPQHDHRSLELHRCDGDGLVGVSVGDERRRRRIGLVV